MAGNATNSQPSIMDLLLPPTSPGIKDPIVDLHGKEEILFMGPDENTADLVDWATEHARARGAPWWKSFFTGKKNQLGGIPHDRYATVYCMLMLRRSNQSSTGMA